MPISYITSPEKDFSLGIDVRSAENQINPGFVRDLLNADIVERRARKRSGYQGYAGNTPIRVIQLEYNDTTNEVCFTLDSAVSLDTTVDLSSIRSTPIIVYGRSSLFTSGDGPFINTTDTAKYYTQFTIPTRKQFIAPSGTLAIDGSEHGLGTTNIFVNVVESTDLTSKSYTKIISDSVTIDETSFDVNIDYTTYQDRNVYVYYADKSTVTGLAYVHTEVVPVGTSTFTISAATHSLSNFNITSQIQIDNGSTRSQVESDSFIVKTNGDVDVTITNDTGASRTYYVLLSAAPVQNIVTGVIGASSSGTITIPQVTKPWIYYAIYLEQTPGGDKELVIADDISYDASTNDVTLSFTNLAPTARNFTIFYEYGDIRSNQLCVTDSSVTTNGLDERPQLTIWGLDHADIYLAKSTREGWVSHIDSYKRSGEQRLISGLGGNLFSAQTYNEAATTYLYPQLYPNLPARTSAAKKLGPLLWDSGDTPARSRGYITGDASGTHWAKVTSVSYDIPTGYTLYTLSVPNKLILDSTGTPTSLSSVISTTANLEDYLTVQDMSYSRHNGSFRIKQIVDGINLIQIYVENESNSSDYDDSNTGGEAGVFTDQYTWLSNAPFIPGDVLISSLLGDTFVCTVTSSSGTTTVSDGIVDILDVPAGVLFNGQRTSDVIPLRQPYPTATPDVTNVVKGDMLSYTGIARYLRVLYVNPNSDISIDISTTSGIATATLNSGDTSYLTEGNKILLLNAGVYTGVQVVSTVPSTTTFTFETSETVSVTGGTLSGNTIQVDENLNWEDSIGDTNVFTCEARWIPIESPDDSFDLTPNTNVRYFDSNDYSAQPFLRSTMVVDNMYFTNGSDEVYKFDGTNNYRAGLFSWQPGLFLTQDTAPAAKIVTNLRSIAYSAILATSGRLTITAALSNTIPIGQDVMLSGSSLSYKVRDYTNDGSNYYLFVDRTLDNDVTATGTISEVGAYRYYFRLNAVDVNNNLIASATTGSQDHVVQLTSNAAVRLKLVGMPSWDVYDYDRLEVQIYRTKLNQVAPFYLVTTIPMDFDNTQGYINYVDAFADSDLNELDIVNTALKGTELGTAWQEPIRSKYITSIGNRLVLGNVKDYPQLELQIVADATVSNSTYAGDTLLFRKDNTDTGTTTNMVDRVKYEWINGFTGTASNFVIGSNLFTFDTSSATLAVAGDWIYLAYSTVATTATDLAYSGWWQIVSVSTNTVTVNLVGAAAATSYPDSYAIATDPTDVPVLLGTDGNLGMVNGDSFDTFDAMRRMSLAINATMRMVDVTISGMETYQPWMVSRGGNDLTRAGKLSVRQSRSDITTIEILPTFSGYNLFVNSIKRLTGDQISASTRVLTSRILMSYENYPEIFDNPTSILDTESDSAIDINSADGQEITGVIPFFGEAAFTSAQQAAVLVVFKTNSIYLVDINQKSLGNQAVQRIETEGLGCTAPYSIAVTKKGIMFANESGVYCLRRDQSIQYIGRYMERNWTENVDINSLSIAQGHHYGVGRVYKLSVPYAETIDTSTGYVENSEVFTYNHTGEEEGQMGSWGRYDNHPATGWANLGSDAFFASTNGRVFSIRNTGTVSDFRDDNEAVLFRLDTRSNDFGNSGVRKVVDRIMIHYRTPARNTGTSVSYSTDLDTEYQSTTALVVAKPTESTGIDDVIAKDIVTITSNVGRRRCVYFAIRIENDTIDESIEIAGIDYKIGGLTDKGITKASQTS